ncbi:hypothetical protein ACFX2J_035314 [Malus domestica]
MDGDFEVLNPPTKSLEDEIAGTPGYMAPETFLTGMANVEMDVYAFGVLMLEVVCGRRPGIQNEHTNYNNSIVYWRRDLYSKGMILEVVDSRMDGDIDEDDMACVLMLGLSVNDGFTGLFPVMISKRTTP